MENLAEIERYASEMARQEGNRAFSRQWEAMAQTARALQALYAERPESEAIARPATSVDISGMSALIEKMVAVQEGQSRLLLELARPSPAPPEMPETTNEPAARKWRLFGGK